MRTIVDLHIHSKYSRACSPLLTPENLAVWADKKGIAVLGTGDFTHPQWRKELAASLVEVEPGLYTLGSGAARCRFMYTCEIASIYKQGDKVRRVHNVVFAPSREAAGAFTQALEGLGANLKADGRPITGIHCDELVRLAKDVDPEMEVVPAHAWTPHFGVFGSLSGFQSLGEAFGAEAKHIWAIETGLSSDPAMNWRVAALDAITLISNSDSHSLHRLGREANVLDMDPSRLSYQEIIRILKKRDPHTFLYTVEFFPEEGRYHLDGHRDCAFSCEPEQTKQLHGVCPVCKKQLLRGVAHRVDDLATRPSGCQMDRVIPFRNALPLEEVIGQMLGVGVGSKKVQTLYESLLRDYTEFAILLDLSPDELERVGGVALRDAIMRMREGKLLITPGYDGRYGTVELYAEGWGERPGSQLGLF